MIKNLFILTNEICDSVTTEEVRAVAKDMEEMGIFHLPYPDCSILVPYYQGWGHEVRSMAKPQDKEKDAHLLVTFANNAHASTVLYDYFKGHELRLPITYDSLDEENRTGKRLRQIFTRNQFEEYLSTSAKLMAELLIVILATKNVSKEMVTNNFAAFDRKLRGQTICAKHTTTLRIGPVTEYIYEGEGGTHRTPRPHLRRGHVRRQHYGPGMSLIKKVFINPTFVNADEEFINSRTAYKVQAIPTHPFDHNQPDA